MVLVVAGGGVGETACRADGIGHDEARTALMAEDPPLAALADFVIVPGAPWIC